MVGIIRRSRVMSVRGWALFVAPVLLLLLASAHVRADCDVSPACTRVFKVISGEVAKARSSAYEAILKSPPPWSAASRKLLLEELNRYMMWDQANELLVDSAKLTWPMPTEPTRRKQQEEQIEALITRILVARIMDHISNRFGYGVSPSYTALSPSRPTWANLKEMVFSLTNLLESHEPFVPPPVGQLIRAYSFTTPNSGKVFNPITMNAEELNQLRVRLGTEAECEENGRSNLCSDDKDNDKDGLVDELDPSCKQKGSVCAQMRRLIVADQNYIGFQTLTRATQFRLLLSAFGSQGIQKGKFHDDQTNFPGVLQEFWFNHFNVDYVKIRIGAALGAEGYERMLHGRMTTTFRHLLEGAILHAAMLDYLDNDKNVIATKNFENTGKLEPSNQNLGRELLELFTLGIGAERYWTDSVGQRSKVYTQTDVEQAALLLTGVNVVNRWLKETGRYEFGTKIFPLQHVPDYFGPKTARTQTSPVVMQKLFCLSPQNIQNEGERCDDSKSLRTEEAVLSQVRRFLAFLADHPRTRENICTKLVNRFVAPVFEEIDELDSADQSNEEKRREVHRSAVVQRCLSAWGQGGDLKAIYEAILTSPEVWSRQNYLRYQKNPLQVVISAFRASGATVYDVNPERSAQVLALGEKLEKEVRYMGLPYRNWITPDGYREWNGWSSPGFLVRWMNSSFRVASMLESLSPVTGRELFAPIMGVDARGGYHGSNEAACMQLKGGFERFQCYRLLTGNGSVRQPLWFIEKRIAGFLDSPGEMLRQKFSDGDEPVPVKTSEVLDTSSLRFIKY